MIEKIKRKKGLSYRARVTLPNGQRTSKTFSKKIDAEKWKRQMLYQIQTGVIHGNRLNTRLTFAEVVGLWFKAKIKFSKSPRTIANYKGDIRKHLLPPLGTLPIQKIEKAHGDQLVSRMREAGYASKTINKLITLLKQVLNYAVDEQLLFVNPLARYPSLRELPREDTFLSEKEIQQLLVGNNREWILPVLVLALNTGTRRGELMGLCWDRVNFESGFIEVTRNLTREGLQETTKSHKKRVVPMNQVVRDLLMSLMREQKHPSYVLVNHKNQPIDLGHFTYRHFKKALERAGLKDMRFHDLRHTYASQFMMKGGAIYDLQKILGHSDLKITSRYAHLSPTHLKQAGNVVSFGVENYSGPQKVHKLESI